MAKIPHFVRFVVKKSGMISIFRMLNNNIVLNNFMILFGVDAAIKFSASKQWKVFKFDTNKTAQLNAGFSHTPIEEESITKVKMQLISFMEKYVPKQSFILDFGCGPGLYMQLLKNDFNVEGIDISEDMLNIAARELPKNKFYHGNFLSAKFEKKFQAIYTIGVLQYVAVSQIDFFFRTCSELLNNNGILFIQYPEAITERDLYYPDRHYIRYSPLLIDRLAKKYFNVIYHKQCFDERELCKYDRTPYSMNPKVFRDGYTLVAERKISQSYNKNPILSFDCFWNYS